MTKFINFLIGSKTYLQYFIPLVIEGNIRNIKSNFFIRNSSNNYWNPMDNLPKIKQLCQSYQIDLHQINEINKFNGLLFMVEGDVSMKGKIGELESGINLLQSSKFKKITFIQNCDFVNSWHKYSKLVDHSIFPHLQYASNYNCINPNNLYLGSPKYDYLYNLDLTKIYKKYHLNDNLKYLVIFYPKDKWLRKPENKEKILIIHQLINHLFDNFPLKIIIKLHPCHVSKLPKNYYQKSLIISDYHLYPNISLELLTISSLALMFSSSANEECIMTNTPYIDINLDNNLDRLSFLNDGPHCKIFKIEDKLNLQEIKNIIVTILKTDLSQSFSIVKQKFLSHNLKPVSPSILNNFTIS